MRIDGWDRFAGKTWMQMVDTGNVPVPAGHEAMLVSNLNGEAGRSYVAKGHDAEEFRNHTRLEGRQDGASPEQRCAREGTER